MLLFKKARNAPVPFVHNMLKTEIEDKTEKNSDSLDIGEADILGAASTIYAAGTDTVRYQDP